MVIGWSVARATLVPRFRLANVTLPLALVIDTPELNAPPVIVPVLNVMVFDVVPLMLISGCALFWVMLPEYVTTGLPPTTLNAAVAPVGLLMLVVELNVKVPVDAPVMLTPPEPLSVVVPLMW